ncbi:MAG: (deoxy)nucleoside triphosphate pyrophosphohydrolase [Candidatus Dojkabacteria bacterium]
MDKTFQIGQKALIINEEGKLLIIKRHKNNTVSLLWDLPGGRIDHGESLDKGLERELIEETKLELISIEKVINISTFTQKVNRSIQVIRIIYLCRAKGNVELSEEHSESKWINPGEYLNYEYPDRGYKEAFKSLSEGKLSVTNLLDEN